MKVHVPSPLRSYTKEAPVVDANGESVMEVLGDLDRQYPGMRFRMVDEQGRLRPHLRLYRGQVLVRELGERIHKDEELLILCALSGG